MEFHEIKKRALEIRDRYAALTARAGDKPWGAVEHMQGFVGDVGDLAKLVMAHGGFRTYPDLKEKLGHELADCLWSVVVLADELGIDMENAFEKTMDELEVRTE
ncbi:MAG: MazG nucleotide pyrophosphohydrolase domain-containing protein [bacterium]|nr:MazG nucleotide pyrophosphohydrolase domain-containing protein [bacterium]MDZ4299690.1 MazG nucleotide pyrophosphohydrolase domain-containing protein [Candidatus Sungbacteria bacterium]